MTQLVSRKMGEFGGKVGWWKNPRLPGKEQSQEAVPALVNRLINASLSSLCLKGRRGPGPEAGENAVGPGNLGKVGGQTFFVLLRELITSAYLIGFHSPLRQREIVPDAARACFHVPAEGKSNFFR